MINGELATRKEIEEIKVYITTRLNQGHDFNFCSGYLSGLLKAGEDSIGIDQKTFDELIKSLTDHYLAKVLGFDTQ